MISCFDEVELVWMRVNVWVVLGNYAYLLAAGDLEVIDVSDPESPCWVATHVTWGGSVDIFIENDLAYIASARSLEVVDIAFVADGNTMRLMNSGSS